MLSTLASSLVKVTQQAALACYPMIGAGDKHEADRLATETMREVFNTLPLSGTIVIGEGERDEAPMLYIGEQVGTGGIEIDIAVDPLEGTNLCAYDQPGSITVLAAGPQGSLLHAPDTYMEKFVVGSVVQSPISLDMTIAERITLLADAYQTMPAHIHIIVLNRPRHTSLIQDIYATGAKVKLIDDGDICGGIDALMSKDSGIHALMGTGAAPEGVITAVATKALGGQMSARLYPYNREGTDKVPEVLTRMQKLGLSEETIYTADDLAQGDDCIFVATGVTSGSILEGIQINDGKYITDTIVCSTGNKPIERIQTMFR